MKQLALSLILSLALTEALELPFCDLVWRMRGRALGLCALVNIVTNPPVVLAHHYIKQGLLASGRGGLMPIAVIALELGAVAVEWLFYRRCDTVKRPFWVSLTANAFSYLAGLALTQLP